MSGLPPVSGVHGDPPASDGSDWPPDTWWSPRQIRLTDGTSVACRVSEGRGRPVVVIHGLASNALLWRNVGDALARQGHAVAALDLRSHGRSEQTVKGHTTSQAASDVGRVASELGWHGRGPVLVGQSWGGNVALRALPGGAFSGAVCVDGGWIHLEPRFASFDKCWEALAPPGFGSATPHEVLARLTERFRDWPAHSVSAVLGNLRIDDNGRVRNRLPFEQHRQIVHSLWSDDPADLYPHIKAPVHLMVAGRRASPDVNTALSAMPTASVSWHSEAAHDLHLQQPETVLHQLRQLLARVEGSVT